MASSYSPRKLSRGVVDRGPWGAQTRKKIKNGVSRPRFLCDLKESDGAIEMEPR